MTDAPQSREMRPLGEGGAMTAAPRDPVESSMREAVHVFLHEVGVHRDGGGGAGAGRGDDLGTRIHDIAGGLRRFMSVRVLGSLHFGVDITGRGEGNRVISSVDERLALALEAAGLGTWTWDMASAATTFTFAEDESFSGLRAMAVTL